MGNTNACCSVESRGKDREAVSLGGPGRPLDNVNSETTALTVSPADVNAFKERLENSISIMVVIADGKKIHCRLRWQPSENGLVMTCEANNHLHIRRMCLDEIVSIISGKRDLGRVATKARITDDPKCVALHLASNTCIPICLESEMDKECFIRLIKDLKEDPHIART